MDEQGGKVETLANDSGRLIATLDITLNKLNAIIEQQAERIKELENFLQQLLWIAEKADTDDSEDTTIELAKQTLKPHT